MAKKKAFIQSLSIPREEQFPPVDTSTKALEKSKESGGGMCWNCPLINRPMIQGLGTPPDFKGCRGVIVGDAPSTEDVMSGVPLSSRAGKLLLAVLAGYAKTTIDDLYITNAVLCHPPNNKVPWDAVRHCRRRLIKELQPYINAGLPILASGGTASKSLTGKLQGNLRGQWHKDQILSSYHPAYIFRTPRAFTEFAYDILKFGYGGPYKIPELEYFVVGESGAKDDTVSEWVDWILETHRNETLCFDIEADHLLYWDNKILSIAIAVNEWMAVVIPPHLIYESATRDALNDLFDPDNGMQFVGHNVKFDIKYLKYQLGVDARAEYDSLVAHYVLNENAAHGLKDLAFNYLDAIDYEGALVDKYKKKSEKYSKIPTEHLLHYNALDVCYNLALWKKLQAELIDEKLWDVPFKFPLMASVPHLVTMELHGLGVDREALHEIDDKLDTGSAKLYTQLEELCGYEFNPNSWQQVAKIMYDHFDFPTVYIPGKSQRTTCHDARVQILDVLESFDLQHDDGYKWLTLFEELKSLLKLRSSYVSNLLHYKKTGSSLIDNDGRIHPDCKLHGAETGRVSFTMPAIQTIPRPGTGNALGDAWGKYIKAAYCTAKPGWVIMEVDYSQAEMRVAAALSGDKFLLDVYHNDRDLHSEVAIAMYGSDYTKEQRGYCKSFNFAFLYGGTEHSFSQSTGMPLRTAIEWVNKYKTNMKELTKWRDEQFHQMCTRGYVETITKRRRRFPLLVNENKDEAKKSACNMPIQGSAADLTLISFIRVSEWLDCEGINFAHVVATVHDSIILEVQECEVDYVAEAVSSIMEYTGAEYFPQVPWKVDVEIGKDWGHLKEISVEH